MPSNRPIVTIRPSGRFPSWIPAAIVGLILLIGVFSSFVTVPADSVGILMRFGKYSGTALNPGLQFKIPFGVDRVEIVPIQRQLKLEMGFDSRQRGASQGTNEDQYPDDAGAERTMLTGDLNMALVEFVIQYRIAEPAKYLFNVKQPAWTLRDASEAIMREVVGDRTIDELLTIGRQDIEVECQARLQVLLQKYDMGLRVDQVQLQNVQPPQPVQASFNEVNQAQQEKQQAINVANGEYNKVVPRAKGEADRRTTEAEGYATKRVNEARGDAERFTAVFNEYLKAPEVTRQRLYLEAMQEIMPQFEKKVIVDDKVRGLLPLLPLDLTKPAASGR
jgi:membrane protease subunit HflK